MRVLETVAYMSVGKDAHSDTQQHWLVEQSTLIKGLSSSHQPFSPLLSAALRPCKCLVPDRVKRAMHSHLLSYPRCRCPQ